MSEAYKEKWVSDCGRVTLYNGDCLSVLKAMPDNSVDSIVTDPPYGLCDKRRESLQDVFIPTLFDVFFPKFNNAISKALGRGDFVRPFDRISFLNGMNRAFGEEPSVGVPKCSVNLDCDLVDWNEKIKHTQKTPVFAPDRELSDIMNSHRIKNGNSFFLKLRACVDSSLGDGADIGISEFGFSRLGVFIVIPFNSCFSSFLRSIHPGGTGFLSDVIRLLNDPKAFSESPSCVVTSAGTELRAVLTFDLGSGTCELKPANNTSQADAVFEVVCPEHIGTITGTSSLAAMFKPHNVSFIDTAANGTFSIYFHNFMIPYITRKSSGFMGKKWDYDVPSKEIWVECLRVLKPGGHLLSFAGTRTQHRMAVNIEDAGFEIRDMIAWVYGSGFPKSLDVSKALDKMAGAERSYICPSPFSASRKAELRTAGKCQSGATVHAPITAPATSEAKQWQGWGTALKPALEPITLARKPLDGTVAANVLEWGTGGINVDGCRVGTEPPAPRNAPRKDIRGGKFHSCAEAQMVMGHFNPTLGRWPANLIHDGSEEVMAGFPETAKARKNYTSDDRAVPFMQAGDTKSGGFSGRRDPSNSYDDNGGSAARFFYVPKASKKDRDEGCEGMDERARPTMGNGIGSQPDRQRANNRNFHPTVKPTDLMAYLCRLVTPPCGLVLDPFTGSGSTGKAAAREGFQFIGIDREADYIGIAKARIIAELAKQADMLDFKDFKDCKDFKDSGDSRRSPSLESLESLESLDTQAAV